jgi:hypothetical protein
MLRKHTFRKRMLAVAAVVAAGAVGLAFAPSSGADTVGVRSWTCVSITGAKACFNPDGDDLSITDTASDGFRAAASWVVNYSRDTPDCVDKNGADNGTVVCEHDLREGKVIALTAAVRDGDRTVDYSDNIDIII